MFLSLLNSGEVRPSILHICLIDFEFVFMLNTSSSRFWFSASCLLALIVFLSVLETPTCFRCDSGHRDQRQGPYWVVSAAVHGGRAFAERHHCLWLMVFVSSSQLYLFRTKRDPGLRMGKLPLCSCWILNTSRGCCLFEGGLFTLGFD